MRKSELLEIIEIVKSKMCSADDCCGTKAIKKAIRALENVHKDTGNQQDSKAE